MAASSLQMSTTIMCLFFGTNFFLMLFFIALQWQKKEVLSLSVKKTEAFQGTSKCYTLLTTELSRMGFIMAVTYICENHWFFAHSGKEYNRDLFMFVCLIFFAYGYITIKPIKDLALLGREQTEEWKGWMQFIFLLYHYFHAEEVYNSVRVMITCYVWMTGFGNFSFFYIKQDFGWLRVVQMLWRLNFAVVFLMMTHGNTYILYYICPLHTFFFLMVYVTMAIGSSWNHGKWSIRAKLAMLGVIIYLIWDFNHGIFQFLFQWLGTESIIGAKGGSVWEWYFRTSLDHWSTYFGMIFALNFPLCEQLFVKLKGWPLYVAATLLGALSIWWYVDIYSLEKMQYNLHHNYFALIPLTSYIYFRNITPYVRSFVSYSFHDVGKTTLETYLLQHHVWLTSNAKTLLTIVPGYPWLTFALASVMFVVLAKELYRLTMTIRGMILPDDNAAAKRNMIGFAVVFSFFGVIGAIMFEAEMNSLSDLALMCLVIFIVSVFLIGLYGFRDDVTYRQVRNKAVPVSLVASFFLLILSSRASSSLTIAEVNAASPMAAAGGITTLSSHKVAAACLPYVGDGYWNYKNGPCNELILGGTRAAYCETESWIWRSEAIIAAGCPIGFRNVDTAAARKLLNGKKIHFCGDSGLRSLYHSLNSLLDPMYDVTKYSNNEAMKHVDLNFQYEDAGGQRVTVEFKWVPRVINMSQCFNGVNGDDDMYVLGMVLWDALQGRDIESYRTSLATQLPVVVKKNAIWVHPHHIVNSGLRTPEKQTYMTEEIVSTFRAIADSIIVPGKEFDAVINPVNVSGSKASSSIDGVHYSRDVYDTTAQILLNTVGLVHPAAAVAPIPAKTAVSTTPSTKPPDSMSFPGWGAMVLCTSFVMLLTMDSFFGIGYFALVISGRSFDYDAAYMPLLNKIFGTERPTSAPVATIARKSPDEPGHHEEEKESLLRSSLQIDKDDGKV